MSVFIWVLCSPAGLEGICSLLSFLLEGRHRVIAESGVNARGEQLRDLRLVRVRVHSQASHVEYLLAQAAVRHQLLELSTHRAPTALRRHHSMQRHRGQHQLAESDVVGQPRRGSHPCLLHPRELPAEHVIEVALGRLEGTRFV